MFIQKKLQALACEPWRSCGGPDEALCYWVTSVGVLSSPINISLTRKPKKKLSNMAENNSVLELPKHYQSLSLSLARSLSLLN